MPDARRRRRGAKSFLTETVSRVRHAGATGKLTVRADSAFYSRRVLHTAVKLDVRFSVTARQDKRIRAALEGIDEAAWTAIPYWLSSPEVSGADVAEIGFTAFTGKDAVPLRLIVRRTRPTPGSRLALFTTWSYHAFFTNRKRADARAGSRPPPARDHRAVHRRAQERRPGAPASGHFMANAARLALAVMAHNLGRAIATLAGPDLNSATAASLRRRVFNLPGRLVRTGRRRHLRLPESWPWADAITTALTAINAIPLRC